MRIGRSPQKSKAKTPPDGPVPPAPQAPDAIEIDAQALRALLVNGTAWLERNVATINALNVFPVPDGDTGTNMLLTMRAALEGSGEGAAEETGQLMRAVARGAVMGARGNSGVILSQIIAGIARGMEGTSTCPARVLAASLAEGAAAAYRAVTRPVEGTILTVARAAGDGATATLDGAEAITCRQVIERALTAAHAAVLETPEQLAMLKQAGVVDAGGEGYRVILEGMAMALRGEALPETAAPVPVAAPLPAAGGEAFDGAEWGYCTQFLVRGEALDLDTIRDEMQALAESTLVIGGGDFVRVHGHTEDPGQLLSYAVRFGRLERISIEDMDAQHDAWLRAQVDATEGEAGAGAVAGVGEAEAPAGLATVAVAPGPGLADVFRSLGVTEIVPGGQTMNPSAHDLIEAARRTRAATVVVLPNNGNVVTTAQHAARLLEGESLRLVVVPTTTVPQGIAAQLAFNPEDDPAALEAAMLRAARSVRSVEITRATRDIALGDLQVREGDALGLLDDQPVAAGTDAVDVARQTLDRAGAAEAEVVTLYRGESVAEDEATRTAEQLRLAYPRAEIEVVYGGQPHYDYVISVE